MMRKALFPTALLAMIAMIVLPVAAIDSAATPTPDPASVSTAPLHDFGTSNPPQHGTTTLYRNDNGIGVTVHTRHLRGNAAHTFWIVIFNMPGACFTSPCGLPDLGNAAAMPSLVFGGAAITTANGQLHVSSGLDVGVAPGPPGPGIPQRFGFGPGLLFPHLSEIHIIVQDHLGPVDLDEIHAMLQRPGTGPLGALDVQSSIHLP